MTDNIMIENGTSVFHEKYGIGSVEVNKGSTLLIRFGDRFEECLTSDVIVQKGVKEAIQASSYDNLREVVSRCQAMSIRTINDSWGVFSKSRISLLPHQLWVCHRVLSQCGLFKN